MGGVQQNLSVLGFPARIFLAVGIGGYLKAGVQCKLFQNIVHMALDGVGGKVEILGDFLIAQPLPNQYNYFLLAFSHLDGFFKWGKVAVLDHIFDYLGKQGICQGIREQLFTFCNCP